MIVRCCYYHHVLLLLKLVVLFLCADYESNERKATLFVSGTKPSPSNYANGGKVGKVGKDDIIGLEQLKTKLSIAESAIAKVTQELVARGEDIGEKKKMMKGDSEEEEEEEEEKEEKNNDNKKRVEYVSSWGSLNNHFQYVSDTYNDYFGNNNKKGGSGASLSSALFGGGGGSNRGNSDDNNRVAGEGEEKSSSNNDDDDDDSGDKNNEGEISSSSSCSPSCSKYHRCVDGKCRCPVLYSGPNCTENGFERAIDTNVFEKEKVIKCAMGVNHDPFYSQYEEKYGEKADRKMRVAHILRSRFIATT